MRSSTAARSTDTEPNNVEARLLLAGILSALDRQDEATAEYRRVLQIEPANQEAYLYLGALYGKQRRFDEALATLGELIHLNPRSVLGYYYLGRVNTAAGRFAEGERNFREALKLNPRSELILMDLATLYELQKQYGRAIEHLSAHPRDQPEQRARPQASRRSLHRAEEARRGAAPVPRAREDRAGPARDADQDRAHLLREGGVRPGRDGAQPGARGRARERAGAVLSRERVRADEGVSRRRSTSSSASAPNPSTTSTRVFRPRPSTRSRTGPTTRSARSSMRSRSKDASPSS